MQAAGWTSALVIALVSAAVMTYLTPHERLKVAVRLGAGLQRAAPVFGTAVSAEAKSMLWLLRAGAVQAPAPWILPSKTEPTTSESEASSVAQARAQLRDAARALSNAAWSQPGCVVDPTAIEGVQAFWVNTGRTENGTASRTLLYVHGSGLVNGTAEDFLGFSCRLADFWGMRVLLLDPGLPPAQPISAGYADVVKVFLGLEQPRKSVVLLGSGAGGNVAFSALLRLRSQGTYMPAATVLISPVLDLSNAFESVEKNRDKDFVQNPEGIEFMARMALGGEDEEGVELASPAFHDHIALAPVAYVWDKNEITSDAVAYSWDAARKIGVRNMHVQREGLFHQYALYFDLLPEAAMDMQKVKDFSLNLLQSHEENNEK